jgi:hypothetical protein
MRKCSGPIPKRFGILQWLSAMPPVSSVRKPCMKETTLLIGIPNAYTTFDISPMQCNNEWLPGQPAAIPVLRHIWAHVRGNWGPDHSVRRPDTEILLQEPSRMLLRPLD